MPEFIRKWPLIVLFCLGLTAHATITADQGLAQASPPAASPPAPPVAARKPVRLTAHGIERVDDYAWLRDPNWREVIENPAKLNPEIRAHLEAENAYADAIFSPLDGLRGRLLDELKARVDPADTGVPLRDGPYAYWSRYIPGAEHPQVVRAPSGGGPEQVVIDGAALAAGKTYFSLGDNEHSPDHRLFAYLVDESGGESFTLHVRDLAAQADLPEVIEDVADVTWSADSSTLFYVQLDAEHRARLVYRHRLGTDPVDDPLVYEEMDLGAEATVSLSRTKRFIIISTGPSDSSEEWLIDAARPESDPVLVAPRQDNIRYYVEDWGDQFVIRTNADGADDFKLVTAPYSAPGRENWRDLVPYRAGRQILAIQGFADYLARVEREDGIERLVIRNKSDGAEHALGFPEEDYAVDIAGSYEFGTRTLRFRYSSPATPRQTFEYDMESRERVLRKQQNIPSGHDPSNYVVRRLTALTADHEEVPITLLHRKGLSLDGSAPLYLEGYGAYAYVFQTSFDENVLSLVDRGFVYAIAHVRGGLEKGERWRNAGRRQNKVNTFNDFIAVAEHLINAGYSRPGKIVARGDSAGGLLMGVVANMRPDLFAGIVARVPFVDALNTMLDDTLPLTVSDFPEWGNPIDDIAAYRSIASYAPYENVRRQPYPDMLVTAGLSDPRVQYWEETKWVAKIRALKTNDARIALVTRLSAGHFGAAGRYKELEEVAMIQAFALDVVGKR
ncbi:MAG: oligopeptidase [Alphaproteobacteria bacterium]|nr:oligopeptidase [Alphaproteobacteria bacterium]